MKTQRTKDMERFVNAFDLCRRIHMGQTDKCGQPYWIHPFTVAMRCFTGCNKTELSNVIVGLLHDIPEDSGMSVYALKTIIDLTDEETEALELLTRKDYMSYDGYIDTIIASGNKLAMEVKLDDLFHNLNRERFKDAGIEMSDKDLQRFEKYKCAFDKLLAKVRE